MDRALGNAAVRFDGCALKVFVHPHLTADSRQWALRRRQDAIHQIAASYTARK
jgi:hypothetical protein